MDNPATLVDLEVLGYTVDAAASMAAEARLGQAWRALQLEVPSLVARLEAGTLSTDDVVDVVTSATMRVLRNPDGFAEGDASIDDYTESWKRADSTLDVYFTAAELRRLSPPVYGAGSFAYGLRVMVSVDRLVGTLERGQLAAESLMTGTFAAYSPTGYSTQDEDTGVESPTFDPEGSTPGKVQARSRQGDTQTRMVSVAGTERPVLEGGLHIPLSAPIPAAGDRGYGWEYLCTAVGPGWDAALLGRRYLVVDVPAKSYATARRLDVVEL